MSTPSPEQIPPLGLVAPVSFQTALTDGHGADGTRYVMLRTETPVGSQVLAMPVDFARTLGQQLIDKADEKPAQGLVVPTVKMPDDLR